jgi:hypothetical protein
MRVTTSFWVTVLAVLVLAGAASGQGLPKPKLRFVGKVESTTRDLRLFNYELEVVNREDFDNELFVPSPALPPCGRNTNASRTWINIYNEKGERLYGHCAVMANEGLASVRFSVPARRPQPKKIFIDLVDRFEERIVRSNTVTVE